MEPQVPEDHRVRWVGRDHRVQRVFEPVGCNDDRRTRPYPYVGRREVHIFFFII